MDCHDDHWDDKHQTANDGAPDLANEVFRPLVVGSGNAVVGVVFIGFLTLLFNAAVHGREQGLMVWV